MDGQEVTAVAESRIASNDVPQNTTTGRFSGAKEGLDLTRAAASPFSTTKEETSVTATEAKPEDLYFRHSAATVFSSSPSSLETWRTTFLRLGPLSGICSMLVALASIVASLGILVGSDGVSTVEWTAPPSTYIAVFTAVANLSMRYACIQGVVIAWWYRASKGTTLEKLHYDWRAGTTVFGAVTSGRRIGLLGVACIFSTLVVIDGPLLQRASTTTIASYANEPISLNVTMAQELPTNFDGSTWHRVSSNPGWTHAFNSTVPIGGGAEASNHVMSTPGASRTWWQLVGQIQSDRPFHGIVQGCPGQCKTRIRAPALSAEVCTTHHLPVNSTNLRTYPLSLTAPIFESQMFFISIGLVLDETEKIYLVTGHYQGEHCAGILTWTACTLESAIGIYDVTVDNDIVVLQNAADPVIVALANNTAVDDTFVPYPKGHPSTLAGVACLAWLQWDCWVAAWNAGGSKGMNLAGSGNAYLEYRDASQSPSDRCYSFSDPRSDVMATLNKIMVWGGHISAAPDNSERSVLQTRMDPGIQMHDVVVGERTGLHSVFSTDYHYFAAAAIVEIVCVLLVAPIYWGWWTLGRRVSFSPLELAKAFQSPILASHNSNSSGRNLAKAGGNTQIQYGAMRDVFIDGKDRLAFAPPDLVRPAENGAIVG